MARLTEAGVQSAVFLGALPNPDPQVASLHGPAFFSTAVLAAGARLELWTGLQWDPSVVPQFATQFSRTGFMEINPDASNVPPAIKADALSLRAIFSAQPGEFMLLIRVGSPKNPEGILVLFSGQSILASSLEQISAFSLPVRKKAA